MKRTLARIAAALASLIFAGTACGSAEAGTLAYKNLHLINGWSVYGTPPAVAIDADNVVHIKGAMYMPGTNPTYYSPFTVPSAFRPNRYLFFIVDVSNGLPAQLIIFPDGRTSLSGQPQPQLGARTSLEGITYPKD